MDVAESPTRILLTFTGQPFLRTANVQSFLHPPPASAPLRLYSQPVPLATSAPNIIWLLPSVPSEWPPNIGGMSGAGGAGYEGVAAPQVPPPCYTYTPLPRIVELRAPLPNLPMPAHALPQWTPHISAAGNDPASLRAIRICRVAGDDRRSWGCESRAAEAAAEAEGATTRADNGGMAEGSGGTNTDWGGKKRRRGEKEGSRGRGGKKRAWKASKRYGVQRGAGRKAPQPLAFPVICPLCPDVVLTSLPMLQSHMAGRKHQAADAGRAQRGGARGPEARAGQEQGGHAHDNQGHGGEGHVGEGHWGEGLAEKGHADRHRGEGGSGAVNGEDGEGGVGGMGGVQGETGLEHGEHGGYGGQGGHGGHGGYGVHGVHGVHVTRWAWGREWQQEEKPHVGEWRDGGVKKELTVEIIDLEEDENEEEEEVEILELDESDKDEVKEEGSDEFPRQGKRARAMGWVSEGPPFVGGWCAVCGATCLNESNYKFHLKGKRHRSARAASHTAAAAAAAAPVP
ncbi:unnamed protein product [Closterium sp. Naga37s-1]|nr:unnamed protein product [Closterium sp. Naga37s-1]